MSIAMVDMNEWLDNPERVTPERIAAEVAEIARVAEDGGYREARELESTLHLNVLAAIGRGIVVGDVSRRSADEAVKTIEIELHR